MKFAAAAVLFSSMVSLAEGSYPGGPPYPLPDGFIHQCCIRMLKPSPTGRKLTSTFNPEFDSTNSHLGGWNIDTNSADPKCLGPGPHPDDKDILYEWVCYTAKQVCEGGPQEFGYPFSAGIKPVTTSVCDNAVNCYNPNAMGADDSCTGPKVEYPDIWWSCGMIGGFPEIVQATNALYCGWKCKFDPEACGDPHFQTWDGEWYDFHGECDLSYLSAPEFGLGLGLDIHVRTKARYEYSYIESAAVKIGDDILEVSSFGEYAFNGVEGADLSAVKFADLYSIEHHVIDKDNADYIIRTGGSENIKLKSFKDLVSVKFNNSTAYNFESSKGMLGDFFESKMLARDGATVIADANEFGKEWQVTAEEPQLFRVARDPSKKCVMPSERATQQRRLGESIVARPAAEEACAHVKETNFQNCVFDAMATGDLAVASTYA